MTQCQMIIMVIESCNSVSDDHMVANESCDSVLDDHGESYDSMLDDHSGH